MMDVFDEIFDNLASVEAKIRAETNSLTEILQEAKETNSLYIRNSGAVVKCRKSISALEQEVGGFINDVDYVANSRAINRLFRGLRFKPIEFNEGGVGVSIGPVGRFSIQFGEATRYYCTLEVSLNINVSQANARLVQMKIGMSFDAPGDGRLIPRMVHAPRFIEDNEQVDIYQSIPVAKQHSIRQVVLSKLNEMMADASKRLDPINLGSIAIVPKPILVIYDGFLLRVISREKGSRRAKEPLVRHQNHFLDETVRLRKHLVEPTIRHQIRGMASVTGITWEFNGIWGYINVSTKREDRKVILHIDVKTKVKMRHAISFTTGVSNSVVLNAQNYYWEYSINAKRCFPVCNKIMRKAKEVVMDGIEAAKYITRTLGHIDYQLADVVIENDRHGLVLGFNRRN